MEHQLMKIIPTKQEIIIDLHERGYSHDFQLLGNDLLWIQEKILLHPEEFSINEYHQIRNRYSGETGLIIFGVIVFSHSVKGILIKHIPKNNEEKNCNRH